MPGKPTFVIRVSKGSVDRPGQRVNRAEGVHWVPIHTDVTIQLRFANGSPFEEETFPANPVAGHAVSAIVRKDAAPGTYTYAQPGSRRRKKGVRADPVIIVRDTLIPKKKAAPKKR